jgi:nucleosome assembly protein 1-like 1
MSAEDAAASGGAGDAVKALPAEQMKRLEALQGLQAEYWTKHEEFVAERKALESKYAALYAGIYARRTDIVTGAVDPADATTGACRGWGGEGGLRRRSH